MKKLSNLMLLSNFVCTLFYATSYPYIYAETLKAVTRHDITFEQIIGCIGTIVFGLLWNRYGKQLFRHYRKMLIAEIIADCTLFGSYFVLHNMRFYFIFNVIIYAVITKNLASGGIRMRAMVNPDEESRNRYDNNSNTVSSAATLIGSGIALTLNFTISTLFVFALIGNIIDNFFYLYIYNKIKEVRTDG